MTRSLLAALLAAVLLPGAMRAQRRDTTAAVRPRVGEGDCVRFGFGTWTPTLASAAPHLWGASVDGSMRRPAAGGTAQPQPAGGRDWAARFATDADSVLVLYPAWWPVGVGIQWEHTVADTLVGVARAFVSDGRVEAPAAKVRAWRVPCEATARP